ncbi:MAG TPA: hypothetical protein VMT52_13130 [Planctomycetota bacterium]|nr:hypothetical protein [Planctomycetota bacterium]
MTEKESNDLYDAGCADATPGVRCGRPYVDFDRKAPSLRAAMDSAIRQIAEAGLRVSHIEPPELVTQTEIAERAGITRQAVSKYVSMQESGSFPAPASRVTTSSPLWRWTEVSKWLVAAKGASKEVADEAETVEQMNKRLARTLIPREPA